MDLMTSPTRFNSAWKSTGMASVVDFHGLQGGPSPSEYRNPSTLLFITTR